MDEIDKVVPLKSAITHYLNQDVIIDFSQFAVSAKLSIFAQKTPKKYIAERKIQGKMIKYVPYQYPRKVLNFIFNFNISTEVIREEYISYQQKFKDYQTGKEVSKDVVEAEATVKYTFRDPDTNLDICRTVKGSHKAVKNIATNRGHAMTAAINKTWTLVAQSFGICADLDKDPEQVFIDETPDYSPPPAKSFSSGGNSSGYIPSGSRGSVIYEGGNTGNPTDIGF